MFIDSYILNHPIFRECRETFGADGAMILIDLLVSQDRSLLSRASESLNSFLKNVNVIFPDGSINFSIFQTESKDGFNIILKNGCLFTVDCKMVDRYQELFPSIYVDEELKNIVLWFLLNPKKRKDNNSVEMFIYKWMSSATTRLKRKHKRVSRTL